MSPSSSRAAAAARVLVAAWLGVLAAHPAQASSCLPLSVAIKAPDWVASTKTFRTKITLTNQGSAWLRNVVVAVSLPVETAVLKVAPASVVSLDNPWSLFLPSLSLAPGKSETIAVQTATSTCYQGSFDIVAAATLSTDPACGPIETTHTVRFGVLPSCMHALSSSASFTPPQINRCKSRRLARRGGSLRQHAMPPRCWWNAGNRCPSFLWTFPWAHAATAW